MSKIALEGQLSETAGTVTVSASPDAGGQLVTGVTNAYDVTICVPVAPVRLKWRIGTSGDWRETEGGECFTVSGGDAQSLYLAKQAAQSASVVATYTVRQLVAVSAAGVAVPVVTYSQTPAGGIEFSAFEDGPNAPVADVVAAVSGSGNLTGDYFWKVTFRYANGAETDANTASTGELECASNSVQLSGIPVSSDAGVVARCIYRNSATVTPATPREALQLVAIIPDNTTTTFLDNVEDASLGKFMPRLSAFGPQLWRNGLRYAGFGIISTAFGYNAMRDGTGYACTAVGAQAMPAVKGDRNTAIGVFAGYSLTLGRYNTAVGVHALNFSTHGESNTAIGYGAIFSNTGAGINTATGAYALYNFNSAAGGGNTANGYLALYSATTGENNTAIGHRALFGITTGTQNTAVGVEAASAIQGNFNTALGFSALGSKTSGNFNVAIGWSAGAAAAASDANVTIGAHAGKYETGSNRVIIDNRDRVSESQAKTRSLIYGVTADAAESQTLALNAVVSTIVTTVAALPIASAALLGFRAFVSDATATTFASTVVGGGEAKVPVYCDGAAWKIG